MNISLFAILFVIVSGEIELIKYESSLNDKLHSIIGLWLTGDCNNSGTAVTCTPALPPIDVIPLPAYEGSLHQYGIKMKYVTGDLKLTGLEKAIVNEIITSTRDANSMDISLDLTIPNITLSSDNYRISGSAYVLYKIKGSGKLNVTMYDVRMQGKVGLETQDNGTKTKISRFTLKYDVSRVSAVLQGSSWPINTVLSKEGASILSVYEEQISVAVEESLIVYADYYLGELHIAEILQLIDDTAFCIEACDNIITKNI